MPSKTSFFYDSRHEGQRIHAIRWQPDAAVKAVLILAHGMAEHIDRYDGFATHLAGQGILVAGGDYLGHGKTVGGEAAYGYICPRDPATVLVRDVHRLKKLIQAEYPGLPFAIMGHSMGSFVVRNYMARYGSGIQAAILMGTGMPPEGLVNISRRLAALQAFFVGADKPGRLLDKLAFGAYNARIADAASPFAWLSVNRENVEAYEADPLCGFAFSINGFQTLFELLNRLHQTQNLKNIPPKLPVLMVSGEQDPVGDYGQGPKKTQESLESAGLTDVTSILYPWGRHEILHEAEKMAVYADIINWLEEKIISKE